MANHGELFSIMDCNVIADVLMTCVILHNMVIEDEENLVLKSTIKLPDNIQMRRGLTFVEYVECTNEIENQQTHYNLKNDLIDHL
jgi:hypothetical protein